MKAIVLVVLMVFSGSIYADELNPVKITPKKRDIAVASEHIKESLLDPDSFQIRGKVFAVSLGGGVKAYCFDYSAKNGHGGYVEPEASYSLIVGSRVSQAYVGDTAVIMCNKLVMGVQ